MIAGINRHFSKRAKYNNTARSSGGLISRVGFQPAALLKALFFCLLVIFCVFLPDYFAHADGPARIIVQAKGGDVSKSAIADVSRAAGAQLAELEKFYGYGYSHPVWIILAMDEKSFHEETGGGAPSWAVAIAQRRKVVMRGAGKNYGAPQFEGTLKHELSHVLLAEMFAGSPPGALPRWLDEGLAVQQSGEWEMPDAWTDSKTELYAALKSGQALDFAEISDSFPFAGWKAKIAYAQSYHFTEYLINKYGGGKVAALLKKLASGEKFSIAFKSETGDSFADTEYYWREHVAGKGGLTLLLLGISRFDDYLWMLMALLVVAGFTRYMFKRNRRDPDEKYLDDIDESEALYEDWDVDDLGFRPWRPGRRDED